MFYIHHTSCISSQQTFAEADIDTLHVTKDNKLLAIEPAYDFIPPGMLRRMGKALRIGIGAAKPLLEYPFAGIILGTGNGGMEDCIKFLNQIVDYNEGMLTPANFVQSTPNAISAQIGLLTSNKGYNITHVHLGLAFENAIIDTAMLLNENSENNYLLGAVDEISSFNYNINYLAGLYKSEPIEGTALYEVNSPGSIAGEGAAMFLVNKKNSGAIAKLEAIHIFQTDDVATVKKQFGDFIAKHFPNGQKPDLFLSGENGDNKHMELYTACETVIGEGCSIARFKHFSGEYPTASSVALWLACTLFQGQKQPAHMIKNFPVKGNCKNILIYNNYLGTQHSFMLLSNMLNA